MNDLKKTGVVNNRMPEWDIIKGILMVCVIVGHLEISESVRHYIYAFHMPLFFLISGYFYKPVKENNMVGGLIRKKANLLLGAYLFIIFLNYIAWILLFRPSNIFDPIIHIFWSNTIDGLPIAGATWFLTSLFFVFLFAIVLDQINKKIKLIIIICAIIAGSTMQYLHFRFPLGIDCALEGLGFFELGFWIRRKKIVEFLNQKRLELLGTVSFLISTPLIFVNEMVNFRDMKFACLPVTWINVILMLVVCFSFSRLIYKNRNNRLLEFLCCECEFIGRNTLVFLGFHQLARWFVIRITNRVFNIGHIQSDFLHCIINIIGCIIVCQILTYFLNNIKPVKKILHISII